MTLKERQKQLDKIGLTVSWPMSIVLRFRGRRDGKRSMLKQTEDGRWLSPYISKEQRIATTFKAQLYAQLEIEISRLQEQYTLLLNQIMIDLEQLIDDSPTGETPMFSVKQQRKIQADAYRHNKEVGSLKRKRDGIRNTRAEIKAQIDETEAMVIMMCEKKQQIHSTRIAIYHQGILAKHPDADKIPPVLQVEWSNDVERLYEQIHKGL